MNKRRLGARADTARATRRRVVDAASRLFVEQGYLDTTMTAIAEEAGVAVQTLYLSVGTKVQLLGAAIDVAVGGDEGAGALQQYGLQAMREEPDGRAALSMAVRAARRVYERSTPLLTRLQEAAADSEVAELQASRRHRQSEFFAQIVGVLAEKKGFNPAPARDRAVDIVYALLAAETFRLLCIDRHWDGHEWEDWVGAILADVLFPADRTRAARVSSPAPTRRARKRT
ncbi:MAG: helix-turn-helix domain-containing protein [Acidimicrobiia bacterium]